MSYDLKLSKACDHKVVWDDHIVEDDLKTVILGVPISSSNVVVRVNDFKRSSDYQNELLLREDVSNQVTGEVTNFYVSRGPIYNGLKQGTISTRLDDVIVRVKVNEENVSEQFTGIENYFYTQARPLMRSNKFDFNCFVTLEDVEVKINNVKLSIDDIVSVSSSTGRIELSIVPAQSDEVTVTYYYKAKVTFINGLQSRVTIKQKPKLGQEVVIAYFSKQNDGWIIKNSERATFERSQDIVFYRERNTNRFKSVLEDVSSQFTGIEKTFQTKYFPLLPIFQDFKTTPDETLNNAALVYINDKRVEVAGVSSENGVIRLHSTPSEFDVVQVTYYYQTEIEPDRISVDYFVESKYCNKCSKFSDLIDYVIDKLGHYEKVIDENKLMQDLKKIIRTILGSDPVATWYGTEFENIIGTKIFPEITRTKITDQIVTALSKLKSVQIQQEEYQKVSENEFLDTISRIDVNENPSIPTLYVADVGIITQSGRLVSTEEIIQTKG